MLGLPSGRRVRGRGGQCLYTTSYLDGLREWFDGHSGGATPGLIPNPGEPHRLNPLCSWNAVSHSLCISHPLPAALATKKSLYEHRMLGEMELVGWL